MYYLQDARTGKQQSLETKNRHEAQRLLEIKRQASADSAFNQIILKTCLITQDRLLTKRTWQTVMDQIQTHGKESSKCRYVRAMKAKAFDGLRNVKLVETTAEDFLSVLSGGKVSVAHYLKRIHNLALGLGWLAFPVLAPRLWPNLPPKPKRAITFEEHQRVLAAEKNSERNLYYQLLWEIGASQSDAAALTNENLDKENSVIFYWRMKTGELAQMKIGNSLAVILDQLPKSGALFPDTHARHSNLRATDFYYLCKRLSIQGVTLHSYRYAWAQRAKACGYPERFAQEALGHNSKAVHRSYARGANFAIPSMDDYERSEVEMPSRLPSSA